METFEHRRFSAPTHSDQMNCLIQNYKQDYISKSRQVKFSFTALELRITLKTRITLVSAAFWEMGTNCTIICNEIKEIGLSHSVDITRCVWPPPHPCLAAPHSCSQFSSVSIASQNDSPRPLSEDHNEVRQTRIHSME